MNALLASGIFAFLLYEIFCVIYVFRDEYRTPEEIEKATRFDVVILFLAAITMAALILPFYGICWLARKFYAWNDGRSHPKRHRKARRIAARLAGHSKTLKVREHERTIQALTERNAELERELEL